eukprot:scaffold242375_cov18-Tisochrysis_lutea.AAC.1
MLEVYQHLSGARSGAEEGEAEMNVLEVRNLLHWTQYAALPLTCALAGADASGAETGAAGVGMFPILQAQKLNKLEQATNICCSPQSVQAPVFTSSTLMPASTPCSLRHSTKGLPAGWTARRQTFAQALAADRARGFQSGVQCVTCLRDLLGNAIGSLSLPQDLPAEVNELEDGCRG